MTYTARVTLTAPMELVDVCAKIGKAFDPDVGGEKSFYEIDGHLETQFPAIPEFAASLPYLIESPTLLHQSCLKDYAARWPELEPPTLAECEQFCNQVTLEVDDGLSDRASGV